MYLCSMQSKSERTRQFIIEKTAPIFNEKGYAGTSISDLTDATGLTKGSIYGNFENKDAVAVAAFDYNFQLVVSHIRSRVSVCEGSIEKLLVYPAIYREFLTIPFLQAGCPVANTALEADDTHPELKERAAAGLQLWRDSLERILVTGMEKGELRPEVNVTEAVAVIAGLIHGAVLQAKLSGKLQYLNASMDFLEKQIRDLRR